jgi:hypothetical protein
MYIVLWGPLRSDMGITITRMLSLRKLEHCIAYIWLLRTRRFLSINNSKLNMIYLASTYCVKSIKTAKVQMGASSITPNGSVTNIEFILPMY